MFFFYNFIPFFHEMSTLFPDMLTINMSASVYSAFGLAGVKFMCNNRKMYRKANYPYTTQCIDE